MAGLTDIGPLRRTVTIRGEEVDVQGISAEGLFHLLDQFPEMRKLMSGGGKEIKPEQLLTQVPGAIASILAAITGQPGDKAAIKAAANLNLGEQAELIEVGWALTFPKGIQSFIEALELLGAVTGSGWGQGTASPEPLSNVSQPDIPQK